MKWLSFKRTDDRFVYLREDDIDYIVTYDKKAKIHQKNGNDQIVYTNGIPERLLWDDPAIIQRRSEILKEDLARANMDIQNRDEEIQDLKLENDLLKKRDEIMLKFIRSVACINCDDCNFYEKPGCIASVLDNTTYSLNRIFKKKADECLQELDNL